MADLGLCKEIICCLVEGSIPDRPAVASRYIYYDLPDPGGFLCGDKAVEVWSWPHSQSGVEVKNEWSCAFMACAEQFDSYGSNVTTVLCCKKSACCPHSVLRSVYSDRLHVFGSSVVGKVQSAEPQGVLETSSGCLRNSFRLSVASSNEKRSECL